MTEVLRGGPPMPLGTRVAAVPVTSKRLSLSASSQQVLGLSADFLVAANSRLLACKYGAHADDQWSMDEPPQLASRHTRATDHPART